MVITMLPMSAFAAATPRVNVVTITDTNADNADVKVVLELDRNTALNAGTLAFEVVNAEFKGATNAGTAVDGWYQAPSVTPTATNNVNVGADKFTVTATPAATAPTTTMDKIATKDTFQVATGDVVAVPNDNLLVTLTLPLSFKNSVNGDVVLRVTDIDNKVGIGTWEKTIAVVNQQSQSLSVVARNPEATVSYDGGEVSRFDIRNFKDTTNNPDLLISLDKDDYYAFDKTATKVLMDGKLLEVNTDYKWDDAGYQIRIPNAKLTGSVVTVIPTLAKMGRQAQSGTVVVDVETVSAGVATTHADFKVFSADRATIGKVVDFGVTMTIVEKNKKEIPSLWGGEVATVVVTLKGPKGSFSNRGIEFSTSGASVIEGSPKQIKAVPSSTLSFSGVKVSGGLVGEAIYKDGKFVLDGVDEKTTEVSFEMRVRVAHNKDGVATLTAAQRGWETTGDLAKVTPKFAIATEVTGTAKGQVTEAAKVVLTEAKEGLLRKGEYVVLWFDTTRDYVEFESVPKFEATNGMTFTDVDLIGAGFFDYTGYASSDDFVAAYTKYKKLPQNSGKYIGVIAKIAKPSVGGAAEITVSGLKVRVDGSTVDGTYKVHAGLNGYEVRKADYAKVSKEYGLESVKTVFTIGQTAYKVNEVEKTAAAAPYIKNGRTMLPVRALAESLGLNVQWNQGTKTATFTDATKVAAVVVGAETMYVNGTPIKLNAKAEIVNGTIFIELRSLATAFGVQIDWDAAAKTATVSK